MQTVRPVKGIKDKQPQGTFLRRLKSWIDQGCPRSLVGLVTAEEKGIARDILRQNSKKG